MVTPLLLSRGLIHMTLTLKSQATYSRGLCMWHDVSQGHSSPLREGLGYAFDIYWFHNHCAQKLSPLPNISCCSSKVESTIRHFYSSLSVPFNKVAPHRPLPVCSVCAAPKWLVHTHTHSLGVVNGKRSGLDWVIRISSQSTCWFVSLEREGWNVIDCWGRYQLSSKQQASSVRLFLVLLLQALRLV